MKSWFQPWLARGFFALWLLLLLGTVALLAVGGRPDPSGSGQPLDGLWRFHPGDDPAWPAPGTDDRAWDRLTLVSRPDVRDFDVGIPGYLDGWRAHGHPTLEGYAWYRRTVTLPAQGDLVLLGPPAVDDGYEMYWNGRPVGGIGRLSGIPKVAGTRPLIVHLPAANGARTGLLAIRTFMQPGINRDMQSGGLRTVPMLATATQGQALYRAQWRRTIAGYVVDAVEPAAMLVLIILVLRASPRAAFSRWLAIALLASAGLRLGNALTAWTDLYGLSALLWQNDVILAPLAKLGWTMAWNQWTDGRDRRPIAGIAIAAWLALVAAALADSHLLAGAGRALFALSLAAIAFRVVRHGDQKWLVLTAMLLTATGLFASDLSALGVPGIWFPFNIGVSRSQFAYGLALPLLASVVAAARGTGDRRR